MVKGVEYQPGKEKGAEKGSRWLRNINALGAVAFGGAGIALESAALVGYGAFNAAQAVFFEITRRLAARRKTSKHIGTKALAGASP